jgi:hypothetical protein
MPARLLIIATLLTVALPLLVGVSVFFVLLPWWIDRLLRSDPRVHEGLRLDVAEDGLVWVIDHAGPLPRPYPVLALAALGALAVTAVETATFASRSGVPDLWYEAGLVASTIVLLTPFALTRIFRSQLCRHIERALAQHANDKLSFAAQTIYEIGEAGRQINDAYASMGLRSRVDVVRLGREALLAHGWLGRDAALAEVIRIRIKAEHDLRSVQYLARLFADIRIALKRARITFAELGAPPDVLEQLDERMRARPLADALEEARWLEAGDLLEKIQADLGKLLDIGTDMGTDMGTRERAMPESATEAFRVLNVNEDTPLDVIKTVINAYRRVWHPDLARDDIERQRCTLRLQQINVAWDLIQKART